jgi:UDP:flavonoid glycosyltransferase YjiC (YdhE family)
MRLLFTTTGHAGHVLPLVPLARACRRAGHEIRIAGPRSRGGVVRSAGLPFWPFDDPPAGDVWSVFAPTAAMPPEEANAVVIGEVFGRLDTGAALPGVRAMVAAWRPDAVVRESYEFASAVAAEEAGIPHLRVAPGLASTEDWLLGHAAAGVDLPLEAIRASPLVSFTPPALDDGPAAHRFRAGAPEPSANRWGDPLVYVTFGSVAAGLPLYPAIYRAALDALADLPVRVLMTIGEYGEIADLGPLPANAVVERWVPQEQVTAHAAAMVCHGGYGTTAGALADGVPLVVAPLFADQGRNAERVATVGAGLALPMPASIDAAGDLDGLGSMVARVLEEPSFGAVARRVAASARALPHVDAASAVLEAIAGRRLAA